jgi:hypothetical protein
LGKATLLVLAQIEVKILTADNFSCPEESDQRKLLSGFRKYFLRKN